MTKPNPSPSRAAAFGAAALILAATFCAAAALAQSGRKAQKPLGLPTEAAKPSDPAGKTPETKKVDALATFVVMKDDTLTMGFDTLSRDGVASAFFERLRRASNVEVKDGGRGRRQEARERAKKEEVAYVVFFQLDETSMGGTSSTDARGLALRTYVYTPKTADLKYSDTIFQRPYQDTARIGGVRVPVPTRRAERYPSQYQLEQAARDAADRLLSRFSITPPPEQ
ncbi:MAG: hypothetical protein QOH49_5139 [Acidobacteriota bacterium]|jgi:hypothetical protein|nr:hypothetical protein [Acidobacteriota bacterium]